MEKSCLPYRSAALFNGFLVKKMNGSFASSCEGKVMHARDSPEWVLRFHCLFVFLVFAH